MNQINSTRFLKQSEFAEGLTKLSLSDKSYEAAGMPLMVEGNNVFTDTGDNHTIIFGATGSKKTRLMVMPSIELLCRAGESFVVTDPKGEIFAKTAKNARKHGYHIKCLDLRYIEKSKSWNPLSLPYTHYVLGETSKAMEQISQIVNMLVEDKNEKDKFWSNGAKDIITGFILLLMEVADNEKECTFLALLELWENYLTNRRDFFEKAKEEKNKTIYRKMLPLNSAATGTQGSFEAYVSASLNRIAINQDVLTLLSGDDIYMPTINEEKTAIYLVIPDENTTYHFVAALFISQLYDVLIAEAQKCYDKKLPTRMNFVIDEFANMPKIENMDSMITAARSRNIRFFLVVQSMKQLIYKYAEYAEVICGNCNNWVYLYSKEYELLNMISNLCGERIFDNNSRIPLISEFELQHLNKDEGQALVLAGRSFPCVVNLRDIDAYVFG